MPGLPEVNVSSSAGVSDRNRDVQEVKAVAVPTLPNPILIHNPTETLCR
jgi:hypothetical protein